MHFTTKVPESMTDLANLMGLEKDEVQAWPYFTEVRNLIKDYNLNVLEKNALIAKMSDVATKCETERMSLHAKALKDAIAKIKLRY